MYLFGKVFLMFSDDTTIESFIVVTPKIINLYFEDKKTKIPVKDQEVV